MLFKILHGDESRISTDVTPFHEGWAYVTHSGNYYIDMNIGTVEAPNNQRIKLNAANAETLCGLSLEELREEVNNAIAAAVPNIELDTTLTQEGKAADAKAVGDAVDALYAVDVYIVNSGSAATLEELLVLSGVENGQVHKQIVETLPETLAMSDVENGIAYVYIVKSTGVAYLDPGIGQTMTLGFMLGGEDGFDHGWSTNINAETELGVYCVRKPIDINALNDTVNGIFETTPGEAISIGSTLRWDGNIDTFEGTIVGPITQGSMTLYAVKMSDSVPSISDIGSNSTIEYLSAGKQVSNIATNVVTFADGTIGVGDGVIYAVTIVPTDNLTDSDGVVFPEAGIYFKKLSSNETLAIQSTSFTIPGYDFVTTAPAVKKIKKELLPEMSSSIEVDKTLTQDGKPADAKAVGDALVDYAKKTDLNSYAQKTELNSYATKQYVADTINTAASNIEFDTTLTKEGAIADAKAAGTKIAATATAADFIVVYDGEIVDFDSFVASNGAKLYVEIIDDVQLNKMQVTSLTEVYVYVERATGFGYLNIGIGDIVPLSELVSNYIGYVEDFGWVIDSSIVTSQSEDGIYTVPVFQPMTDVDRLPTAVINTNITYRVAHEDGYDAKLYMWSNLNDTEPIDMLNALQLEGLKAETYVVDALPETLKLSIIDEQDISSSCLYIYIDNNTGIAYVDVGLGAMPFGETVLGFADIDKGWSDDIYANKEIGVFTVKIPVYHYTYHNYKNGKWFSYVDEERLFDTVISPAADIGDTVSYDGNLDNAIYVGGEDYGYAKMKLYVNKISDSVFTLDDLANGWSGTSSFGTTFSSENEECADIFEEDFGINLMSSAGADFWIVSINENNTDILYEGIAISFETAGTYVVHSIITLTNGEVYQELYPTSFTINGYNFKGIGARTKQIKPELLPEVASSVEVDATLTKEGKAADAKAVGDGFDAIISPYSSGLSYGLMSDGAYCVTGIGACTDTDIVIPPVWNGKSVTRIMYRAFYNQSTITSVKIPSSVTRLEDRVFEGCTNLQRVVIPKSVIDMGMYVFFISQNAIILCEAESEPSGWNANWFAYVGRVFWGVKLDLGLFNIEIRNLSDKALDRVKEFRLSGDAIHTETNSRGIYWETDKNSIGAIDLDDNSRIFPIEETSFKVPIAAGRGVTFELKNNIVKINAEGGMLPITHAELKVLRDNSELIPGMFYRITDYVCTTTQADTRAMSNKFDIIVQALSENTLSEIAKADYHAEYVDDTIVGTWVFRDVLSQIDKPFDEGSETVACCGYIENTGYGNFNFTELLFIDDGGKLDDLYVLADDGDERNIYYRQWISNYAHKTLTITEEPTDTEFIAWLKNNATKQGSASGEPKFKPEVFADDDGTLVEDAIVAQYYIFDDFEDMGGDAPQAGYKADDKFIAYDYLENYDGDVVPVIYKTDMAAAEENPDEFGSPDYEDTFYYVGTEVLDGVTYDKWRKINDNSDNMNWQAHGAIYVLTNVVIGGGGSVVADKGYFKNSNLAAWELKYCLDNDTTRFAWALDSVAEDDIVGTWVFKDELTIPEAMWGTKYYFTFSVNKENVGLQIMNEFRFGSLAGDISYYGEEDCFEDTYVDEWGNNGEGQIITITEEPTDETFIAWLKANATKQDSNGGGKGVIYYMKDEHGNECPYDFKNIQFKRYMITETEHESISDLVGHYFGIPNGNGYSIDEDDYIWCYTFTGCDSSDSLSEVEYYDMSADPHRLSKETIQIQEENGVGSNIIDICKYNIIKELNIESYLDDVCYIGRKVLNNIVFYGNFYDNPDDFDYRVSTCYNNTVSNNSYSNTFGDSCNCNTFGNKCYSNTFGNSCSNNTFGDSCNDNTFGNSCCSNYFARVITNNVFGTTYQYNNVAESFHNNVFGNNCQHNTFGNSCSNNTFGDSCSNNTFGHTCSNNVLEDGCYSNTFGSDNRNNSLVDHAIYVRFADGCQHIRLVSSSEGDPWHNVRNITVAAGVTKHDLSTRELQVERNAPPVVFEAAGTTHIILD